MKRTSYFLLTALFLIGGNFAFAGNGNGKGKGNGNGNNGNKNKGNKHCKADADFVFKIDSCTVSFTDSSLAGNNTIIKKWEWRFGDGSKSKRQNPSHIYSQSGTYDVCLTVKTKKSKLGKGKKCKKNTICKTISVTDCGKGNNPGGACSKLQLKPDFTYSLDSCMVNFNNTSKVDTGVTILNYLWSFGDGDTAIGKTPVHKYKFKDHYTVCLTIVGQRGKDTCKETHCEKIEVKQCAKKFISDPLDRSSRQGSVSSHQLEVYPNPASSSTNINFNLSKASQVAVTVRDIQGRTIATLQNGYLLNGNHTLNWDVTSIPAGVYLIIVKTANKIEQKQLMLQK